MPTPTGLLIVTLTVAALSLLIWFWLPRRLALVLLGLYLGLFLVVLFFGRGETALGYMWLFVFHPFAAIFWAGVIGVLGGLIRLARRF